MTRVGPQARTVLARVRRRVVPFLFLLYIVAYLDRINVGFAALQMNRALGFSATTYGFGAGIFFLSYVVFEIPSNVILARVGARLWIARSVSRSADAVWRRRAASCAIGVRTRSRSSI